MRNLLLVIAAAAGLAGCASMGGPGNGSIDPNDARPRTYDYEPSTLETVGNAALAVPATIVWWPYKIVTSAGRGLYDGVAGGVNRAPVPAVGVLFSPLTAAAGAVNGTFRGIGRGPAYVGGEHPIGEAFGSTISEPIPLWKDQR
jgi:hypothetical protein